MRASRIDSGQSLSTMRVARPSAIAVLPTPGSPISTGLVLGATRQHLHAAADLLIATDHGVDFSGSRSFVEIYRIFLERFKGAFGVGIVDIGDTRCGTYFADSAGDILAGGRHMFQEYCGPDPWSP